MGDDLVRLPGTRVVAAEAPPPLSSSRAAAAEEPPQVSAVRSGSREPARSGSREPRRDSSVGPSEDSTSPRRGVAFKTVQAATLIAQPKADHSDEEDVLSLPTRLDGTELLRDLADLAGDEIRRLMRFTLRREATVMDEDCSRRHVEGALRSFFSKLDDYVSFAVRRVSVVMKSGVGLNTNDPFELEGAILQRQLKRALHHGKELEGKVEELDKKYDLSLDKFQQLRRQYYKEVQNWKQRCSSLQMRLVSILPQDAEVDHLFEDVTFFNENEFLDDDVLDMLQTREREITARHNIETQMLHRQIHLQRLELEKARRNLSLAEDDVANMRAKLQFHVNRTSRIMSTMGMNGTSPPSSPPTGSAAFSTVIKARRVSVSRRSIVDDHHGHGEVASHRQVLLQHKVDEGAMRLEHLREVQEHFRNKLDDIEKANGFKEETQLGKEMLLELSNHTDDLHRMFKLASTKEAFIVPPAGQDEQAQRLMDARGHICSLEAQLSTMRIEYKQLERELQSAKEAGGKPAERTEKIQIIANEDQIRTLQARLRTAEQGQATLKHEKELQRAEMEAMLQERLAEKSKILGDHAQEQEMYKSLVKQKEAEITRQKHLTEDIRRDMQEALEGVEEEKRLLVEQLTAMKARVAELERVPTPPPPQEVIPSPEPPAMERGAAPPAVKVEPPSPKAKDNGPVQAQEPVVEVSVPSKSPRPSVKEPAAGSSHKTQDEKRRASGGTQGQAKEAASANEHTSGEEAAARRVSAMMKMKNKTRKIAEGAKQGVDLFQEGNFDFDMGMRMMDSHNPGGAGKHHAVAAAGGGSAMGDGAEVPGGMSKMMHTRAVQVAVERERRRWKALLPRTHSADAAPGCGWRKPGPGGFLGPHRPGSVAAQAHPPEGAKAPEGANKAGDAARAADAAKAGEGAKAVEGAKTLESILTAAEEEADFHRSAALFESLGGGRLVAGTAHPTLAPELEKLHMRVLQMAGVMRSLKKEALEQHMTALHMADAGALETKELRSQLEESEVRSRMCWELQRQCLQRCQLILGSMPLHGLEIDQALTEKDPARALQLVEGDLERGCPHRSIKKLGRVRDRALRAVRQRARELNRWASEEAGALLGPSESLQNSVWDAKLSALAVPADGQEPAQEQPGRRPVESRIGPSMSKLHARLEYLRKNSLDAFKALRQAGLGGNDLQAADLCLAHLESALAGFEADSITEADTDVPAGAITDSDEELGGTSPVARRALARELQLDIQRCQRWDEGTVSDGPGPMISISRSLEPLAPAALGVEGPPVGCELMRIPRPVPTWVPLRELPRPGDIRSIRDEELDAVVYRLRERVQVVRKRREADEARREEEAQADVPSLAALAWSPAPTPPNPGTPLGGDEAEELADTDSFPSSFDLGVGLDEMRMMQRPSTIAEVRETYYERDTTDPAAEQERRAAERKSSRSDMVDPDRPEDPSQRDSSRTSRHSVMDRGAWPVSPRGGGGEAQTTPRARGAYLPSLQGTMEGSGRLGGGADSPNSRHSSEDLGLGEVGEYRRMSADGDVVSKHRLPGVPSMGTPDQLSRTSEFRRQTSRSSRLPGAGGGSFHRQVSEGAYLPASSSFHRQGSEGAISTSSRRMTRPGSRAGADAEENGVARGALKVLMAVSKAATLMSQKRNGPLKEVELAHNLMENSNRYDAIRGSVRVLVENPRTMRLMSQVLEAISEGGVQGASEVAMNAVEDYSLRTAAGALLGALEHLEPVPQPYHKTGRVNSEGQLPSFEAGMASRTNTVTTPIARFGAETPDGALGATGRDGKPALRTAHALWRGVSEKVKSNEIVEVRPKVPPGLVEVAEKGVQCAADKRAVLKEFGIQTEVMQLERDETSRRRQLRDYAARAIAVGMVTPGPVDAPAAAGAGGVTEGAHRMKGPSFTAKQMEMLAELAASGAFGGGGTRSAAGSMVSISSGGPSRRTSGTPRSRRTSGMPEDGEERMGSKRSGRRPMAKGGLGSLLEGTVEVPPSVAEEPEEGGLSREVSSWGEGGEEEAGEQAASSEFPAEEGEGGGGEGTFEEGADGGDEEGRPATAGHEHGVRPSTSGSEAATTGPANVEAPAKAWHKPSIGLPVFGRPAGLPQGHRLSKSPGSSSGTSLAAPGLQTPSRASAGLFSLTAAQEATTTPPRAAVRVEEPADDGGEEEEEGEEAGEEAEEDEGDIASKTEALLEMLFNRHDLTSEVVDVGQQADMAWEAVPSRFLSWLRLNLMQRQQALMYSSSWNATEMEDFSGISLIDRERLLKDFEEFLFGTMCLQRPARAVDVRKGLRQRVRKELFGLDAEDQSVATPQAGGAPDVRPSTAKSQETPTITTKLGLEESPPFTIQSLQPPSEAVGTASPVAPASQLSVLKRGRSMAAIISSGVSLGAALESSDPEATGLKQTPSSDGILDGSSPGPFLKDPEAEKRRILRQLSDLLGLDLSVAKLEGVQQDVFCTQYAAGGLPIEHRSRARQRSIYPLFSPSSLAAPRAAEPAPAPGPMPMGALSAREPSPRLPALRRGATVAADSATTLGGGGGSPGDGLQQEEPKFFLHAGAGENEGGGGVPVPFDPGPAATVAAAASPLASVNPSSSASAASISPPASASGSSTAPAAATAAPGGGGGGAGGGAPPPMPSAAGGQLGPKGKALAKRTPARKDAVKDPAHRAQLLAKRLDALRPYHGGHIPPGVREAIRTLDLDQSSLEDHIASLLSDELPWQPPPQPAPADAGAHQPRAARHQAEAAGLEGIAEGAGRSGEVGDDRSTFGSSVGGQAPATPPAAAAGGGGAGPLGGGAEGGGGGASGAGRRPLAGLRRMNTRELAEKLASMDASRTTELNGLLEALAAGSARQRAAADDLMRFALRRLKAHADDAAPPPGGNLGRHPAVNVGQRPNTAGGALLLPPGGFGGAQPILIGELSPAVRGLRTPGKLKDTPRSPRPREGLAIDRSPRANGEPEASQAPASLAGGTFVGAVAWSYSKGQCTTSQVSPDKKLLSPSQAGGTHFELRPVTAPATDLPSGRPPTRESLRSTAFGASVLRPTTAPEEVAGMRRVPGSHLLDIGESGSPRSTATPRTSLPSVPAADAAPGSARGAGRPLRLWGNAGAPVATEVGGAGVDGSVFARALGKAGRLLPGIAAAPPVSPVSSAAPTPTPRSGRSGAPRNSLAAL